MKRLVVCCDGTWKAESSTTVSNIIKIAQTIRIEAPDEQGRPVAQWVTYVPGPGTQGFLADRLMGGAFGLGLEANLSAAYWHLALNWEPGIRSSSSVSAAAPSPRAVWRVSSGGSGS